MTQPTLLALQVENGPSMSLKGEDGRESNARKHAVSQGLRKECSLPTLRLLIDRTLRPL